MPTLNLSTLLPPAPLAVGFSGGRDSTALLYFLHQRHPAPIVALHLNHGLRGEASDGDEHFCREFCAKNSLRFFARKIALREIIAANPQKSKNLEAAARRARWEFFAEICARENLAGVALAHHRDDQIETIFLRLMRGAGWRGLQGMREQTVIKIGAYPLTIWRPWLQTPRAPIENFLRQNQLAWREDASNDDWRFARNFLRRRVFPAAEKFLPDYREQLEKFAAAARAHLAKIPPLIIKPVWNGGFIPRQNSAAITVETLAAALENFLPDPPTLRKNNFADLEKLLRGKVPAVNLPKNFYLRAERDGWFVWQKKAAWQSAVVTAMPFVLRNDFFELRLREISGAEIFHDQKFLPPANRNFAFFTAATPLVIRPVKREETLIPLGKNSAVKAGKLLADAKIPARCLLPVIADNHGALWLAGVRLADRARVNPNSAPIFHAEIKFPAADSD